MVRTGGTLKPKLINLIGQLDQDKTLANINKDITALEKRLRQEDKKLKINVELFGNVKDIAKNISDLQKKLEASPSFKDIRIGVALEDVNVKDINEQIEKVQKKFNEAKTANKLKLDVEFDFTGSASKIKEEMEGIRRFMERYGEQMRSMDIINLDDDAQNVRRNTEQMKNSIGGLDRDTKEISNNIEAQMQKMTGSSGKFAVDFKQDFQGAITGANASLTDADGTVRKFTYGLDESGQKIGIVGQQTKLAGDQSERYQKTIADADKAQKDFNKALADAPHDENTRAIVQGVRAQEEYIEEMRKAGRVTNDGSDAIDELKNATKSLKTETENLKLDEKFREAEQATREAVAEFKNLGGAVADVERFENAIDSMEKGATGDMERLQNQVKEATQEIVQSTNKVEDALNSVEFKTAIKDRDINAVRRYVEEVEEAEVASIKFTERTDRMGRTTDRVAVSMKEANGAVDSYTYDLNRAEDSLKRVNASTKTVSDTNTGLGAGFAGILGQMSKYIGAMEIIQKSLQLMKETIREIMAIDAQRVELARVADSSINLDVMLERSVGLAKELGSSVEDVMKSVGEMARTFGDFNEQQLLALTHTATLMTNVSDLSMEESTSSLVATMQAFNIEAEDSIRIVDTLNEVDNNYAVSTNQLAEGMSRAGATASTFGVEMEELAGDITAISSVTQESGEKIGTALRTIYSRVTTMEGSREILEGLGIAMYEMGSAGPEIRNVSDILGDLADQWSDLSSEQQQNIGVTIAGRSRLTQLTYELSHTEMCA